MVPSNFVEVISEDNGDKIDGKDIEVFAASEEDVHKASQIIKVRVHTHKQTHTHILFLVHMSNVNNMLSPTGKSETIRTSKKNTKTRTGEETQLAK